MVRHSLPPSPARAALAVLLLVAPFGLDVVEASDPANIPMIQADVPLVVPCVDYDVTRPDGSRAAGHLPENVACNFPQIDLVWRGSDSHGEGDLRFDLAQRDFEWLHERTSYVERRTQFHVYSADDVVLVEAGPMALLERIVPALGDASPQPAPPERVFLHVRFTVVWLTPDCHDASGTFEAELNGGRIAAQPNASFFEIACRLGRGHASVAPTLSPPLAAEALTAAVPAAPRLQTHEVAAAIAALRGTAPPEFPAPAQPSSAPRAPAHGDVDVPSVGAQEGSGMGAAQGDVTLLAAPAQGEASASEDVEVALVVAQIQQTASADLDASQDASVARSDAPRAPTEQVGLEVPTDTDAPGSGEDPDAPIAPPGSVRLSRSDATAAHGPAARAFAWDMVPVRDGGSETAHRVAALALQVLVLLAFALYQRVARPAALEHPARAALHAALVGRGGPVAASELAQAVGIGRKTAEYHLCYLARLGLVREERAPDAPRRFAPPAAPRPAMQASLDERLIAIVRESSGVTTAQVAASLAVTPTRADRRLKGLVLAGRLESEMRGGERRFFLGAPPAT